MSAFRGQVSADRGCPAPHGAVGPAAWLLVHNYCVRNPIREQMDELRHLLNEWDFIPARCPGRTWVEAVEGETARGGFEDLPPPCGEVGVADLRHQPVRAMAIR
jgi:hypothetical protein